MNTFLIPLIILLSISGCVSVREARRYAEIRYLTGKLEGLNSTSERLFPIINNCREEVKKLSEESEFWYQAWKKPYTVDFEALTAEAAKETDRKLKLELDRLLQRTK